MATDKNNMSAEAVQRSAPMYQPELETMSREALQALQLERLQNIVTRAYGLDHYRQAFDAAGVTPGSLQCLDDLNKFPFTVKDDLRKNYPFGMLATPREEVVRLHASSGTTGRPTVVGYTAGDIDTWTNLMARSLACAGAHASHILHNAYGYGLFTGGLGAHYGGERLGCSVVPMSGGNTEKQVMLINDFGAHVLCCTPSYALNIVEIALQQGIDLRDGNLKIGLFGGEPWSQGMRKELEQSMGIKAVDIYGLSEIMGPGVAVGCSAEQGLHGWEDHFLFELIDPQTGMALPDDAEGELVITTLTKEALPIIRYRTHDITRLNKQQCECGRTHVRIMGIAGRNDDMMIIRGVNVYPSQMEAAMIGFEGLAPHYQLIIQREGVMDSLRVEVEASPELAMEDYSKVALALKHHIKSMIGVTCTVELQSPGAVPRSMGKAVRVIDCREN